MLYISEKFITAHPLRGSMTRVTTRVKAVGNNGVMLYVPAGVRDELGLKPGDPVIMDAAGGVLKVTRDWFSE